MLTRLGRLVAHTALKGVVAAAKMMPKGNKYFSTFTITNGTTPYLTRVNFPRFLGMRPKLHLIHRPDSDRDMHNHPWGWAFSIILVGSYIEERADPETEMMAKLDKTLGVKPDPIKRLRRHVRWFNTLNKTDFHKIIEIDGPLWTLFIAGDQQVDENGVDWGFIVDDTRIFIPHDEYIALTGAKKV